MKKAKLSILLLPLLALTGCKGKEKVSNPKSMICYKADGTPYYKHVYGYDKHGNNTTFSTFDYDVETKTYLKTSESFSEFDKKGHEIKSEYYEFDEKGENRVLSGKSTYEYDGDKLVKECEYLLGESSNLVLWVYEENYVYDSEDRLVSYETYRMEDESTNKYELHAAYTYEYKDSIKEFAKKTITFYSEGEVSEVEVTNREFDEKGRISYEISDSIFGGKDLTFYTYDENNEIVSKGYYHMDETGVITIDGLIDNRYTKKHNLVEITITTFDDAGHPERLETNVFEYDKKDNMVKHSAYTYDSETNQYVLDGYYVYEY